MEAKLIKTEVNYLLENEEGVIIASTSLKKEGLALSLKNCEAIANGYDLDELASERLLTRVDENSGYHKFGALAYKEGFQKALEVNDDKRFTLEDMMNCWNKALKFQDHKETLGEHIRSIQQTEWDVEIVMDICGDKVYVVPEPKLDADGFIILKRK